MPRERPKDGALRIAEQVNDMFRYTAVLLLLLALNGCAVRPFTQTSRSFLHDDLFLPTADFVRREDIFRLSPQMREFVHSQLALSSPDTHGKIDFFKLLRDSGKLTIDYDATATRTAAQTFDASAGNCLSLAIMTVSIAKELGLGVEYREILGYRNFTRSGEILFFNNHVNVRLTQLEAKLGTRQKKNANATAIIDFLPDVAGRELHFMTISEQTIIAMFYNNRAAESLAAGAINDAYWSVRAAIDVEPRHTPSYNTLGVIYRRHGNLDESTEVLEHALEMEPGDRNVMSNLIQNYLLAGRSGEAAELQERLARMEKYPPFHYFEQGVKAMRAGDFSTARRLFEEEIKGSAYYHDFHYWLALAYLGLKDAVAAKRHLLIAHDNAPTLAERRLYDDALQGLTQSHAVSDGPAVTAFGVNFK